MSLDIFDVSGQKVLLVGAGRGIGKGIALAFAQAGADVAVTGLTSTGVNQVAEEIRAMGGTCLPLTGDATKAEPMDEIAAKTIAEFGQIDTLINCVGDAIRKPVVKLPDNDLPGMTEAEWHNIVDINLTEAFQGCRAVGPHLLERRAGSVINISGWASFRGRPLSAAYDAVQGRRDAVHGVRRAGMGALRRPLQRHRARHLPRPGADDSRNLRGARRRRRRHRPIGPGGSPHRGGIPGRLPGLSRRNLRNRPDLGHRRRRQHQTPVTNAPYT